MTSTEMITQQEIIIQGSDSTTQNYHHKNNKPDLQETELLAALSFNDNGSSIDKNDGIIMYDLEDKSISLHLQNWILETENVFDSISHALTTTKENAPLTALTVTDCQWKSNNQIQNDNLDDTPEENNWNNIFKSLQELQFYHSRVPTCLLKELSRVASMPLHTFHMDVCSGVTGSDMSLLLQIYQQQTQLQNISIPILMDAWTGSLLTQLRTLLLKNSSGSSSSQNNLTSLQLGLQAVPCSSHHTTDAKCQRRKHVWSLWKNYLSRALTTNTTHARSIQTLEIHNLTGHELLELADVLEEALSNNSVHHHDHQQPPLTIRLSGRGIRVDCLTRLIYQFGKCSPQMLRLYLDYTLFPGEELNAKTSLRRLQHVVAKTYCVHQLDLTWSEHSPWTGEEVLPTVLKSMVALNAAGRSYLVQDPANIIKGVQVLSNPHIHNDLTALFIHLRENPALCTSSPSSILLPVLSQQFPCCNGSRKRKCSECSLSS